MKWSCHHQWSKGNKWCVPRPKTAWKPSLRISEVRSLVFTFSPSLPACSFHPLDSTPSLLPLHSSCVDTRMFVAASLDCLGSDESGRQGCWKTVPSQFTAEPSPRQVSACWEPMAKLNVVSRKAVIEREWAGDGGGGCNELQGSRQVTCWPQTFEGFPLNSEFRILVNPSTKTRGMRD